jgi:hypothetical protein
LPYLLEDQDFINNVKNHPKIFTGFSDNYQPPHGFELLQGASKFQVNADEQKIKFIERPFA